MSPGHNRFLRKAAYGLQLQCPHAANSCSFIHSPLVLSESDNCAVYSYVDILTASRKLFVHRYPDEQINNLR